MNFLKETIKSIISNGYKPEDVLFVGSRDTKYRMSWEEFEKIADFDYDSGFGSQGIATDLVVVFTDMRYLYRFEYDGAENWQYSRPIQLADEYKSYSKVGGDEYMWKTLEEINDK
jgi:hypothetical protein